MKKSKINLLVAIALIASVVSVPAALAQSTITIGDDTQPPATTTPSTTPDPTTSTTTSAPKGADAGIAPQSSRLASQAAVFLLGGALGAGAAYTVLTMRKVGQEQ